MEEQSSPNVKSAVNFFNNLNRTNNNNLEKSKLTNKPSVSKKPTLSRFKIDSENNNSNKKFISPRKLSIESQVFRKQLDESVTKIFTNQNWGDTSLHLIEYKGVDGGSFSKQGLCVSRPYVHTNLHTNKSDKICDKSEFQCNIIPHASRKRETPLPGIKIVPLSVVQKEKVKTRTYKKLLAVSTVSQYCYKR